MLTELNYLLCDSVLLVIDGAEQLSNDSNALHILGDVLLAHVTNLRVVVVTRSVLSLQFYYPGSKTECTFCLRCYGFNFGLPDKTQLLLR